MSNLSPGFNNNLEKIVERISSSAKVGIPVECLQILLTVERMITIWNNFCKALQVHRTCQASHNIVASNHGNFHY
jgi:hypothetical protein